MTDRIPLSDLTADQLDALYARVDKAEQEADSSIAAAAHLTTLVGKRSEKAEKDAASQRQRAKIFETELHVLRSGLRANGADPTQIQNLWAQIRLRNQQWRDAKQCAEWAEAAIERVRAIHSHGRRTNTCNDCGQPWPCEVTRALAPAQQPRTAEKAAGHNHADSL